MRGVPVEGDCERRFLLLAGADEKAMEVSGVGRDGGVEEAVVLMVVVAVELGENMAGGQRPRGGGLLCSRPI